MKSVHIASRGGFEGIFEEVRSWGVYCCRVDLCKYFESCEDYWLKGFAMNRNCLWLLVAALAVGWILTTMLAKGQQAESQTQWEYKAVVMNTDGPFNEFEYGEKVEAKLNELGKDGWELADWESVAYVLKRRAKN